MDIQDGPDAPLQPPIQQSQEVPVIETCCYCGEEIKSYRMKVHVLRKGTSALAHDDCYWEAKNKEAKQDASEHERFRG